MTTPAPSKVEALVWSFLHTDGDSLYLLPHERLYLMKGQERVPIGREPLTEETFFAVIAELRPGADPTALAKERTRIPVQIRPDLEPVEIRFGMTRGRPAMMVARMRRPGAAEGLDASSTGRIAAPVSPPSSAPSAPLAAPPPSVTLPSPSPAVPAPFPTLTPDPAAAAEAPREPKPEPPHAAPPEPVHHFGKTGRPLDDLLILMLELKASDVHLSAGNVPVFRIHGEMQPQNDMPLLRSDDIERLLSAAMPERNQKEFAEHHDTDFAYEIKEVARFRVNVFRDRHGVGAVFRQIPIDILTAEQLALPEAVVRLGDLSKGLVLVTGPTGSGKSTTLAAIVDYVNKTRTDHIITIEDPIEFVHQNRKCLVNQREVASHTRSFKDALRAALREDPDIVLVGEMRDLETIAIAIETAETGHLVFGTLHTTTATSTVDRIVDQFPADRQQQIRVMLADSLKGVVAQTLCKKIGGGRVAALEILLTNNAVANLIRDGKTFQLPSVLQTSRNQGMILLNDSLVDLVKRKLIEPREAYVKCVDKTGLLGMFRSNGIPLPAEAGGGAGGGSAGGSENPPAAPGAGGDATKR
jgi:twitching motility protein PilT